MKLMPDLADAVRATLAALRAAQPEAARAYLVLAFATRPSVDAVSGGAGRQERHMLVRRLFAGSHKQLASHGPVVLGCDLDDPEHRLMALSASDWYSFEVHAHVDPPGGLDQPFEGVFDIRKLVLDELK